MRKRLYIYNYKNWDILKFYINIFIKMVINNKNYDYYKNQLVNNKLQNRNTGLKENLYILISHTIVCGNKRPQTKRCKIMKINDWLKVKSKAGNFVGQINFISDKIISFRIGTDNVLIISSLDIISYEYVMGRDIEFRKNGRYFVY